MYHTIRVCICLYLMGMFVHAMDDDDLFFGMDGFNTCSKKPTQNRDTQTVRCRSSSGAAPLIGQRSRTVSADIPVPQSPSSAQMGASSFSTSYLHSAFSFKSEKMSGSYRGPEYSLKECYEKVAFDQYDEFYQLRVLFGAQEDVEQKSATDPLCVSMPVISSAPIDFSMTRVASTGLTRGNVSGLSQLLNPGLNSGLKAGLSPDVVHGAVQGEEPGELIIGGAMPDLLRRL